MGSGAAPRIGRASFRRLVPPSETALSGKNITIRLAEHDLSRARCQTLITYQTYLEMLLHEALDDEEKRFAS